MISEMIRKLFDDHYEIIIWISPYKQIVGTHLNTLSLGEVLIMSTNKDFFYENNPLNIIKQISVNFTGSMISLSVHCCHNNFRCPVTLSIT